MVRSGIRGAAVAGLAAVFDHTDVLHRPTPAR